MLACRHQENRRLYSYLYGNGCIAMTILHGPRGARAISKAKDLPKWWIDIVKLEETHVSRVSQEAHCRKGCEVARP